MAVDKASLQKFNDLRRENFGCINLNPIQRGGILSPQARKGLRVRSIILMPPSMRSCLGISAPILFPIPPATIIAEAFMEISFRP